MRIYALTIVTILAVGSARAGFVDLSPPPITQGLDAAQIEQLNKALQQSLRHKKPRDKIDELEQRLDELEQRNNDLQYELRKLRSRE